jgi:glyoxylase-like metal-dependent hydrolase (beta-lactamase superfamily II)
VTSRALVEVADGVHVATSPVYATTTTVITGPDGRCLVVDPAVTAVEVGSLAATLHDRGWRPVAVWSTHPHWDHLLDTPALRTVPRWGAAAPRDARWRDRAAEQRDADPVLAAHLAAHPGDRPAPVCTVPPRPFPTLAAATHAAWTDPDGWERLDWGGPEIRVLRHDAHCAGHTALIVVDAGVLVAGDMLSDAEVPLLDDSVPDPVGSYREPLERLGAGVRRYGADLVVPGHGTVGGPGSALRRIADDLRYLAGLTDRHAAPDPRLGPGTPGWLRAADLEQRRAVAGGAPDAP